MAVLAIKASVRSVYRYPDFFNRRLIDRIAEKSAVAPNRVTLGSGLVGLIDIAVKALSVPGQNIVTADVTFEGYKLMARANRRECRMAELTDNTIDLDRILDLCDDGTAVIFIANPNNPTGTALTHDQMSLFLTALPERIYVVVDEAYGEYVDDPEFARTLELQDRFPNLITFRTFSKVYGLAGLRIGYVIAQPEAIEAFTSCRIPFAVSSLAAEAASAALDDGKFVEAAIRRNARERLLLYAAMRSLGYQVTPSKANFIYVEFDSGASARRMLKSLEKEGILVRDLENFGVDSALRITIGKPAENRRLIETLRKLKHYA